MAISLSWAHSFSLPFFEKSGAVSQAHMLAGLAVPQAALGVAWWMRGGPYRLVSRILHDGFSFGQPTCQSSDWSECSFHSCISFILAAVHWQCLQHYGIKHMFLAGFFQKAEWNLPKVSWLTGPFDMACVWFGLCLVQKVTWGKYRFWEPEVVPLWEIAGCLQDFFFCRSSYGRPTFIFH